MDELKATYIQEAQELLENLESSLLVLEDNPSDHSNIEQVFRVMHTLKGNSSMFGLSVIAEFVHDLETIYDKIRQSKMDLSKGILNCTLAALDHLKLIIFDSDLNDAANKENHFRLISEIRLYAGGENESGTFQINNDQVEDNILGTYFIQFEPNPDFLLNGSNPLLLINELAEFGPYFVVPHFKVVEDISKFDPTTCIASWDILLETDVPIETIKDVFIFAEDDARIDIHKFLLTGIIQNESFIEKAKSTHLKPSHLVLEDIIAIAESIPVEKIEESGTVIEVQAASTIQKKSVEKEKAISSIRVSSDKLDELMNLVSELVTTQASLSLFSENNTSTELEVISENIEKLSRRLRDISFGMTLVQINNMFARFQRLVRDMSEMLGKEVVFITEGGETELDKTIIETLTDPLMHIIRNSMDHGIEKADVREKKGKSRQGMVKLKAYYSGVSVFIQIIDDGKGIDVRKVREKAISKGFMREEDELSDKEIFDFIFYPGFSTAEVVTDVSGRGVGMDVVKRNITDLKGSISVESKPDHGTTLTIKLPLSLSIIDGLLVDICGVNYVIPLSVVRKCYEVRNADMLKNFNKLLLLDERQVPYINLREEFEYEVAMEGSSQLIVVSDGDHEVGISVDHIVGEYQAVVKPISKYYRNQDFVSGATILGDGSIALVLDTHKIVELYTKQVKMEGKL
jgi:two-component system chemotaxis sensor kinase CheA